MSRASFALLVAAVLGLSGCFGGDEGGDEEPSPTMDPQPELSPSVNITDAPQAANASEAFTVNWTVDTGANATAFAESTAVFWSNASITAPNSTADYGTNSSTPQTNVEIPGNFSAELTIEDFGTIYVRAHAAVNGTDYWSEEMQVEIAQGVTGTVVTVDITGLAYAGMYNPDPVEVVVGDGIVWSNMDPNFPHTATAQDGSFDTGQIADGSESEVIFFFTEGTFDYYCTVHGEMFMTGSVEVSAA